MTVSTNPTTPITCGIFLYDMHQGKILICHASHASRKTWTIPKGLKHKGEISYACAERELKEETGIDLNLLNIVRVHIIPPVTYQKQNKILHAFLVLTDTDLSHHVFACQSFTKKNIPEIDAWKWIRPDMIKKYLHESQQTHAETICTWIEADKRPMKVLV